MKIYVSKAFDYDYLKKNMKYFVTVQTVVVNIVLSMANQ